LLGIIDQHKNKKKGAAMRERSMAACFSVVVVDARPCRRFDLSLPAW
jgi:hypothetical protein